MRHEIAGLRPSRTPGATNRPAESAAQARRQAHLRRGVMTPIQNAVRDARGVRPLSDMLRDIGLTVRSLGKRSQAPQQQTLSLGAGKPTHVCPVPTAARHQCPMTEPAPNTTLVETSLVGARRLRRRGSTSVFICVDL